MNLWRRFVFISVLFFISNTGWSASKSFSVAPFQVQGPKEYQYLSQTAQEALAGPLVKQGIRVERLSKPINPKKLSSYKSDAGEGVVSGHVFVVGDTCRARINWKDLGGAIHEEYLEVGALDKLFGSLENFALTRLASAQPVEASVQQVVTPRTPPAEPEIKPSKPAPQPPPAIPPPQEEIKITKKQAIVEKVISEIAPQDVLITQRLPYDVRGLAYGDLNQDGEKEIILTAKNHLYLYHLQGKVLQEIAKYSGENLDNFVKVDLLNQNPDNSPRIVLTNLRGDQAASQILKYQSGKVEAEIKNIPYQLRVVNWEGRELLLAQPYRGDESSYPIYETKRVGNEIKLGAEVDLPSRLSLYNFEKLVPSTNQPFSVAALTPSGKLKVYRQERGKYESIWTSREAYGESGNDVAVELKDIFQEVQADYYVVPNRVILRSSGTTPEVIVSQGDMLLKEMIGRKPVVTRGQMVRLKWSELGMQEAWRSAKIDGSILDYLVTDQIDHPQMMVAVRMRDQGFFEDMGKKDSVLLIYNLR